MMQELSCLKPGLSLCHQLRPDGLHSSGRFLLASIQARIHCSAGSSMS